MSNISKLVGSFVNATNENTLALANLNFDFALCKFEAPQEFKDVGINLSQRRRGEAEDGSVHKSARRLGALFRTLVPATPNLIRAYGTRASEIAAMPSVNPKSHPSHGPFADFVGIDATSLWAAATSASFTKGLHAPLAVHLLACMLARVWDHAEAVSIWVELVEHRRRDLESSVDEEPLRMAEYLAAKHEISRTDLALWDSSARAWLRSADEAKCTEHTKFRLIANNISVDISEGRTTYDKVVDAWQHALQGMENLLQGIPQEAADASSLLALSAWHIYPDLIVLGQSVKKVTFKDPLVKSGGAITVGLQYAEASMASGMHWSLTLSHLQYYASDIKVTTRNDMDRVTMNQLLVVAFGSLMTAWVVSESEEESAAHWLLKMLSIGGTDACEHSPSASQFERVGFHALQILAKASSKYLELRQGDKALCLSLVRWGRRRGKDFLGDRLDWEPFFGMRNWCVLAAMKGSNGFEAAVQYYREQVSRNSTVPGAYLLRYREGDSRSFSYELITLTPCKIKSAEKEVDGEDQSANKHHRWLIRRGISSGNVPVADDSDEMPADYRRAKQIRSLGEICHQLTGQDVVLEERADFLWRDPPTMFTESFDTLQPSDWSKVPVSKFRRLAGAEGGLQLFIRDNVEDPFAEGLTDCPIGTRRNTLESIPTIDTMVDQLSESPMASKFVHRYLRTQVWTSIPPDKLQIRDTRYAKFSKIFPQQPTSSYTAYQALFALSIAYLVYNDLDDCNISLAVVSKNLGRVSWLMGENANSIFTDRDTFREYQEIGSMLQYDQMKDNRHLHYSYPEYQLYISETHIAMSLACIVYFESGVQQLSVADCKNVFAVASGNSIFVPARLLSDPLERRGQMRAIRRLVGNVGTAGLSLIIPPYLAPRVRSMATHLDLDSHLDYDGKEEDKFSATSLHMRLTGWKKPYHSARSGNIDDDISFVESVISVHDSGKWVADLDVMRYLRIVPHDFLLGCSCPDNSRTQGDARPSTDQGAISLDTWDEILDPPEDFGIVRAKGNWAARLAVFMLQLQKRERTITFIVPPEQSFCTICCPRLLRRDQQGIMILN